MEIHTNCAYCNSKIILGSQAITRNQLAMEWGNDFMIVCPNCNKASTHNVQNVQASGNTSSAASGAIIGGLIGLIFGPEGALIGSAIGGAGGLSKDEEARKKVERFNQSI